MIIIRVDSSYTKTKDFVNLSFVCRIGTSEVTEVIELGKMLMQQVSKNYKKLIKDNFLAKSKTPYVFGKNEQLYMIWSFTGENTNENLKLLKKFKIKEVDYD